MEPAAAPSRLARMRRRLLVLLPLLMVACTGPSTAIPDATAPPAAPTTPARPTNPSPATPTPAASASPILLPLPADVSGIPGPGQSSVVLEPETTRGAIQPGVPRPLQLGHCGLGSPIDFDGSLWNPVAGHDGQGGPLTEEQRGELINATEVTLVVLTPDVAELHTPAGAVITIVRLAGGRPYFLCM